MPSNPQSKAAGFNRDRLHPRLVLMVLMALAPAVAMCLYVGYKRQRDSVDRVKADALRLAELAVAGQAGVVDSTRQLLVALAELPQIKAGTNQAFLNSSLRNLLRLFPACAEFGLADKSGTPLASSSSKPPDNLFSHQPFLQTVLNSGRFAVGAYEPGGKDRPAGLWFGFPIRDATRGESRVLYAVVDVRALNEVTSRARLPAGAELVVCDSGAVVLARFPDPGDWVGRSVAQTPLHQRAASEVPGTMEMNGLGGTPLLFAFAPVRVGSASPLRVWVGIPKEAGLGAARDTLVLMLLLLGMVTLTAWVATRWYAAARILRPVNQLVSVAERLGSGDWTARTGLPHGPGELGQLARTFDELARALQIKQLESEQAAANLRAAELKFRTLVEQSLVGIYILQDGNWIYVNPKFCEIVGRTPEALVGQPVLEVIAEADRELVGENIRKRLQGSVRSIRYHLRCVRPDGTLVHVEAHGAVGEANGRPAIIGALLDVTEQVQAESEIRRLNSELEERVALRTAELQAANQELESFSYSVSHDLRAPLRHVQGYVEMLARAAEGQLSEKARRYLKTISDASVEMGMLIDDLLAFSRMARAELNETRVALDSLVRDALRGMELATRGRNIQWNIAPLPEVLGDPAMLKLVFVNLFSNAVKYTRPRDPAVIEIGVLEGGSGAMEGGSDGVMDGRQDAAAPALQHSNAPALPPSVTLFVRDNGVGFDMQYAHKLFGVFQRLHRAEEFEGTGIGLATVRRIIARHGGRTWAESAPDRGATFYFTLATQGSNHAIQTL